MPGRTNPAIPALMTAGLVLLCAAPLGAELWSEFRGPTGQGLSSATGLPERWSDWQNVRWKQPVPGHGWSTPVLVGTRLLLTTAVETNPGKDKTDRSLRALCLATDTGETLWDVEVFLQDGNRAAKIHKKNSHASPTPIYQEGKLYVHFGHDGTACLDARDGRILWKQTSLRYQPVHGNGGSPIIVDGNLVLSCDGAKDPFVVALDKKTGAVVWKTMREIEVKQPFSFSTPLLIEVDGKRQIISAASGAVCAYDPETGKEIWRCRYGKGYSVVPRPSYAHGLLYVCTGFNTAHLLAIRPDGRGDVTDTHISWEHKKAVPKNSSPIVVDDLLFMVDDKGVASCLDAISGEVRWQERLRGNFSASPIYADGVLFFPSEEGKVHLIEAGDRFRSLGTNEMNERIFATVVPADGTLYIRGEENLFRVGR
ncbi:MAG: PQQ-binding-like beta-propeller repeat protein [Verrucomicrobiales bacterium]